MRNRYRITFLGSKLLLVLLILGQLTNSISINDFFDVNEPTALNNDAEKSNEGKNLFDLMEDNKILITADYFFCWHYKSLKNHYFSQNFTEVSGHADFPPPENFPTA